MIKWYLSADTGEKQAIVFPDPIPDLPIQEFHPTSNAQSPYSTWPLIVQELQESLEQAFAPDLGIAEKIHNLGERLRACAVEAKTEDSRRLEHELTQQRVNIQKTLAALASEPLKLDAPRLNDRWQSLVRQNPNLIPQQELPDFEDELAELAAFVERRMTIQNNLLAIGNRQQEARLSQDAEAFQYEQNNKSEQEIHCFKLEIRMESQVNLLLQHIQYPPEAESAPLSTSQIGEPFAKEVSAAATPRSTAANPGPGALHLSSSLGNKPEVKAKVIDPLRPGQLQKSDSWILTEIDHEAEPHVAQDQKKADSRLVEFAMDRETKISDSRNGSQGLEDTETDIQKSVASIPVTALLGDGVDVDPERAQISRPLEQQEIKIAGNDVVCSNEEVAKAIETLIRRSETGLAFWVASWSDTCQLQPPLAPVLLESFVRGVAVRDAYGNHGLNVILAETSALLGTAGSWKQSSSSRLLFLAACLRPALFAHDETQARIYISDAQTSDTPTGLQRLVDFVANLPFRDQPTEADLMDQNAEKLALMQTELTNRIREWSMEASHRHIYHQPATQVLHQWLRNGFVGDAVQSILKDEPQASKLVKNLLGRLNSRDLIEQEVYHLNAAIYWTMDQ